MSDKLRIVPFDETKPRANIKSLYDRGAYGIAALSFIESACVVGLKPLDLAISAGAYVAMRGAGFYMQGRQNAAEIAHARYLESPEHRFDQLCERVNAFSLSGDSISVPADSFTNEQRIPTSSRHGYTQRTWVCAVETGKKVETGIPINEYLSELVNKGVIVRLPYEEAGYEVQNKKNSIGKHLGVITYAVNDEDQRIIAMATTATIKESEGIKIATGKVIKQEAYSRSFFSLQQGVELVARTVRIESSFRKLT